MSQNIKVEFLRSDEVPEHELAEFKEVEILSESALRVVNDDDDDDGDDAAQEAALLKKFVCGESAMPDMYTKLEPYEQEEEEVEFLTSFEQSAAGTSTAAAAETATAAAASQLPHKTFDFTHTRTQRQRKRSLLDASLQGLMGEANLCQARGDLKTAEKICLEIIRQNPLAFDPFVTLASLYEHVDDEKFLNYLTIAAHLNPHLRDIWIQIADLQIQKGNFAHARVFYSKAIKYNSKDFDMRLRRGRLLEQMNELTPAMYNYLKVLPLLPVTEGAFCLATAKRVAQYFYQLKKPEFALEAMSSAFQMCSRLFTAQDLNLYAELLILNKSYELVVQCLRQCTGLKLETKLAQNYNTISMLHIPADYPPDLLAKLCVSLLYLGAQQHIPQLIANVHVLIPISVDCLELYLDIAEAMMQQQHYNETLQLLQPITADQELECPPFVWLKLAECLRLLNRIEEAIESYERVVEMAPFCYEAKYTLSALLKQQGRHLEAIQALEQPDDDTGQPLNARLLYERCLMLQQIGKIDEFLQAGYTLLGRYSIILRTREELIMATYGGAFYNADALKEILNMRNLTEDSELVLQEYNKHQQDKTDLTLQDEFNLFLQLLRTAFAARKYNMMERICFVMITTKRFISYRSDLERIIIIACYFNDDCNIAFSHLREMIAKNPLNTQLWNILTLLVQKGQTMRYRQFGNRLMKRLTPTHTMRLFIAHYRLHACSYVYALKFYMPIFKEEPTALVALCIGVVFNQLSMQKKVLRRPAAVAQAIAFVQKYVELRRGENQQCAAEQEIFYNLGRVHHQAGLVHVAMEYYERGLACHHPVIEEMEEYLGLKHEIAYNLHLIYRHNGNLAKARDILYKYCVV